MKKKVFVNHTNQISAQWSAEKLKAASEYGEIVDLPCPKISPSSDEIEIQNLAKKKFFEIMNLSPEAVFCQCEFSYLYALVTLLKKQDVTVLTASFDETDNSFVRFRKC